MPLKMGYDSDSGGTSCEDHPDGGLASVSRPIHPCSFEGCKMVFSRPWRLEAHLRAHSGERPFKCAFENCSSEYTNNSHLRRHVKTAHLSTQREIIRCNFGTCIQEFASLYSLKRHIRVKHEKVFQFTCSTCNKGFKKRHKLKEHMYNHTGIPTFICHVCNVGLVSGHQLRRHLSRHKSYACPALECKEIFQTWSALRKHSSSKHNPKGFKCEQCGKSFKLQHNYQDHLNTHLPTADRSFFICPYKADGCNKSYPYKRNLMQHIKSFHEKISFDCSLCKEQFTTKQKVTEHISKKHCKTSEVQKVVTSKERKSNMKQRKTSGKPTRSMTSKLLGISLPPEQEKRLIEDKECSFVLSSGSENLIEVDNLKLRSKVLSGPEEPNAKTSGRKDEPDIADLSISTCVTYKAVKHDTNTIDRRCDPPLLNQMDLGEVFQEVLGSLPNTSVQCLTSDSILSGNVFKVSSDQISPNIGFTPENLAETFLTTIHAEELIRQQLKDDTVVQ